jgi:type IV secretion system protein VirD4
MSVRLLLGWRETGGRATPPLGFNPNRVSPGPDDAADAEEAPMSENSLGGNAVPGESPLYAKDEGHLLTIAPTGAGKGRSAIIPALLTYEGPTIVVDPKGEACAVTSRHRAELGPVVCIDPYGVATEASGRPADTLNPFDLARYTAGWNELHTRKSDSVPTPAPPPPTGNASVDERSTDARSAEELPAGDEPPAGKSAAEASREAWDPAEAALLLADLLAPPTFSKDPFWDNRATSLIAGLTAYLLTCAPPTGRHPLALRKALTADDTAHHLAVLLDTLEKKMGPFAYEEIAQFLSLSSRETRPSVLASATQHLTLLGEAAVQASVRQTSFDLEAVRRGDLMTVYLILPPEKLRSHGRLLRLWVATLLRAITSREQRPEVPTLFLLDEAAQLGRLEDLVTAVTLLRGYGVRVWSFWQSLDQIQKLYPNEWQTLVTNARTLQVFGSHWLFIEELAGLLGVHPGELTLPTNQQLLVHANGDRTRARKADYLTDTLFEGRYDPNPLFRGWRAV